MVKVKAEHVDIKGSPGFGGGHGIYPEYFIFENEEKRKTILNLMQQVRTLLRMMDNLREVFEVLHELEKRLKNRFDYFPRTETAGYALFVKAAVLYGACFVKGAKGKRPIDSYDSSIRDCSEHKSYMIYRDKLFAHLDDDHDVRADPLLWTFYPVEGKLMPKNGVNATSYISMISEEEIYSWKMYTHSLLEGMGKKNQETNAQINKMLGHLEIEP